MTDLTPAQAQALQFRQSQQDAIDFHVNNSPNPLSGAELDSILWYARYEASLELSDSGEEW